MSSEIGTHSATAVVYGSAAPIHTCTRSSSSRVRFCWLESALATNEAAYGCCMPQRSTAQTRSAGATERSAAHSRRCKQLRSLSCGQALRRHRSCIPTVSRSISRPGEHERSEAASILKAAARRRGSPTRQSAAHGEHTARLLRASQFARRVALQATAGIAPPLHPPANRVARAAPPPPQTTHKWPCRRRVADRTHRPQRAQTIAAEQIGVRRSRWPARLQPDAQEPCARLRRRVECAVNCPTSTATDCAWPHRRCQSCVTMI